MNIFSGLEQVVEVKHPLAKHTWYGLGGTADYFIKPKDTEQLKAVVRRCNENGIPIYVLGCGSNLLVSDSGVKGAVVKLDSEEFKKTDYGTDTLTASAGVELGGLVLTCVRKGLSGTEALTGIPGSIGGAVKMNAGGNFGDIGTAVTSVLLMEKNGEIFEKNAPELVFDYRSSNITAKFILQAKLKLSTADPEQIMRTVKEVWIHKKNSQPLNTKNAGCVFKNPRGVSAGALIDRAGLKDTKIGGAVVSSKHANFIIAEDNCKSSDVLKLINLIKQKVKEEFDIELELEIEVW